jgi:hypothetical protein|tara:strand:+ start:29427 stop:29816 length:390 start_codon:yes stop_codon:yes gene_type:complete
MFELAKEYFRSWISKREPWFFENSKVPVWLSKVAPIEINAVNIVCFVFSRGKMLKTTQRHETIHYHQQIEMAFLFHWVAYAYYFLKGLVVYRNGRKAYSENPFEREANDNQKKHKYLYRRPLWNWVNYR